MRYVAWSILIAHGGLLAWCSMGCGPVQSEDAHLAAGISHVLLGRFDLYRVNPPFVRTVGALSVLGMQPATDWGRYDTNRRRRSEHAVGIDFAFSNRQRTIWLVRVARWTCIAFGLCGCWICYAWATELFGKCAGNFAMSVWCFSPYILGHASTIMPDAHAAAIGAVAVYSFWRWLKRPRWLEVIISGLALGLAGLCKFTLLVFWPLLPLLWFAYRLQETKSTNRTSNWIQQSIMLTAALLIGVCVVNTGYLFEGTLTPLECFEFQSELFSGCNCANGLPQRANQFVGTGIGKLPVPLPANVLQGIDTQRFDFERGLPSYLRGEWSDHGWWNYYLYALAVKVPLGTLCLVVLAVGVTTVEMAGKGRVVQLTSSSPPATHPTKLGSTPGEARRFSATWRDEMIVLTPGLAILFFVSSQTGFSVHSRYVIPALPFFFIWVSKVGRVFDKRPFAPTRGALAATVVVALTWSVGSSLWVYPHNLSYFNELAGGPRNGGEHLLDSNIDWGQDLLYLKDWLEAHGEVKLDGLAYWGSHPATLSGIPETPQPPAASLPKWGYAGRPLPSVGPKPGWYAVSVNYLYGQDSQYRYYLDHFEPIAMAGYSIYIYHITLDEAIRVRRKLGLPELSGPRIEHVAVGEAEWSDARIGK